MSRNDQTASERIGDKDALWKHIGQCLQRRRTQLGLTEAAVADYIGVPVGRYAAFEAGSAHTPAAVLAQAAELFEVSIFYFFQAYALSGEEEPPAADATGILVVATDEDRSAALLRDFHAMDRERQQYLLMLARVLATGSEDQ